MFLQVIAVHTNQLPKLMQAVIAMIPEFQPYFTSQPPQALAVTSVWTQFLSTILGHCKKVITHTHPAPMQVEEKEPEKEVEEDKDLEAVAGKACTFTVTGNNYTEQHWYFCYTCRLVGSEGCCSVCARVCHRGHDIGYSRYSRFFCDCGASTTTPCKSLKPIKVKSSHPPSSSGAPKKSSKRTPHVLRMVEAEEDTTATQEGGLPVSAPLPQPTVASLLGVVSKESLVDTLFPVFAKLLQLLKVFLLLRNRFILILTFKLIARRKTC